jgi:peptidoglycan/LPS O-acetylase OafA/YrhL
MLRALQQRSAVVPVLTADARDDRLLPEMRWAALIVFVILVPAVVVLWGTPDATADRWAWPVKPHLSAMFLGSGYAAGAYFFWRTFRADRWHPSSPGVLGASVFAGLMLLATLIHYDKFNHGHAPVLAATAFFGWTIVYIVSPVVVFGLWWRNRATDPRAAQPGDPLLAPGVLLAARVVGVATVAAGLLFFISPQTAIDVWPWKLTPLTARVIASFTVQVGVGALVLSGDRRWSAWRLIVQTFFVATAFLLIAAVRGWDEFQRGRVAYVAGLLVADLILAILYVRTEPRAGR